MVVPLTQLRAFSLATDRAETPICVTRPIFFTGLSNGFAFAQNGSRKLDEAEKLFLAALLEAKEGFGLRDPHVASALNNLAEFYRLKKEYEKAELLYLEAIEILEESFGSNDIRYITDFISFRHYRLEQLCIVLEYAIIFSTSLLKPRHVMSAKGSKMVLVLSLQGKRNDAESLTKESIRILEEAGLGESPTCIQRMRYLSTVLAKSKRFAEAEIWLRKILHTQELTKACQYGWDSLETTYAADLLSLNFQTLGKFKESEELMERSLAAKKKILHEDHSKVAFTLVLLARLTLHKFLSDMKNANSEVVTYYLARAKQLSNDSIRIAEGILNSSSKDQNKLNSTSATDRDKIAAIIVLVCVNQSDKEQDYRAIEEVFHKCISLYKEPHTRRLLTKAAVRHEYMRCLRGLVDIVEGPLLIPQMRDLLGEAQQIIEELGEES
nr:unnamed protein product [Digitaria exilis]